jgi:UDP-galactopyranose mutase
MHYDYLIVGAGLFGCVVSYELTRRGKSVLVIDRRNNVGGNIYTENIDGIEVHKYGPHIFHTDKKAVWDFINRFAAINSFINCPIANYRGEIYNLPFNMNTFYKMWGTVTPAEAQAKIEEQRARYFSADPKNLEEQAINLVGTEIYEKLIKGYTEKQWGRPCPELPPEIIKRLPVRFTYNNNYFTSRFQGIPEGGYTKIARKLLEGAHVKLGTDFMSDRKNLQNAADRIVFTGKIDAFYDCKFGELEYRSLRFEETIIPGCENYQGNAVINFTSSDEPYTRIIEHKHFDYKKTDFTVITKEFPEAPGEGSEPYYPVGDERNIQLYEQYKRAAEADKNVFFGGRLGLYKYYDMDKIIEEAWELVRELYGN